MASLTTNTGISPCAACKFLRRKCQPDCVFAPYFPPDQPQKFANVHKVFGASNVAKLLNELHPHQREDAVNSLAYEAEMRFWNPVYGCVGVISLLQHQLRQLQLDLTSAKSELSKYQTSLPSSHHHHGLLSNHQSFTSGINNLYHHQFFPLDQHHHHHQMLRGFDCPTNDYDAASLLTMNVACINGPLGGQFHQPRAAAGDDLLNIDLS